MKQNQKLLLFMSVSIFISAFGLWITFVATPKVAVGKGHGKPAYQSATTMPSIEDTYITSLKASEPRGGEETIWVGYNRNQQFGIQRSLLKFDLSNIPSNSTISSADLVLYLSATTPGDSNMAVKVSRLNGEWDETITWNEFNNNSSLIKDTTHAATKAVLAQPDQEIRWDVRNLVQNWIDESPFPESLALLVEGNEAVGQHERGFWSRDCGAKCTEAQKPQLIINYSPPATPTPVPTPTPGVMVNLSYVPSLSGTAILPDEPITFTVAYSAVNSAVEKVKISAIITGDVNITDSGSGQEKDQTISWNIGKMELNASDQQSFKIVRKAAVGVQNGEIEGGNSDSLTRSFVSNLSGNDPIDTCYQWDFGDGIREQGLNMPATTHTYIKPGRYTVKLMASQRPSFVATASTDITVTDKTSSDITNGDQPTTFSQNNIPCALMELQSPIIVQAFSVWEYGGNSHESKGNLVLIDPKSTVHLPYIAANSKDFSRR